MDSIIFRTSMFLAFVVMMRSVQGQQVPCFFVFGDSQFDNGNNNNLFTSAKVNYYPYGIDYPGGQATGRFANGKIVPDYLAQYIGLNSSPPPFVSATAASPGIVRGLNYASGLAGILDETGTIGGGRFTFNQQIANHASVVAAISALRGDPSIAFTENNYLNRCLYAVNIGNNDYLNNYLVPLYTSSYIYTPAQYADLLIQSFSQQLTTLYSYGMRKVAVFAVGLLGCVPQVLSQNPSNGAPCVGFVNDYVQLFNTRLVTLINNLNRNLSGARFIIVNSTGISITGPQPATIRFSNVSCCPTVSLTGLCVAGQNPCADRSQYAFWDNYHVTSTVNQATAARAYNAAVPTDTYPVGDDINRLEGLGDALIVTNRRP